MERGEIDATLASEKLTKGPNRIQQNRVRTKCYREDRKGKERHSPLDEIVK